MKLSDKGQKFIEAREGNELQAYKDTRGLLTIGIGHLLTKDELSSGKLEALPDVKWGGMGISREESYDILTADLWPTEKAVNDAVRVALSQEQYDVLVSFAFNVGVGAFRRSTLLRVLNRGEYTAVPDQLMRWCKNHDGSVNKGLRNRRVIEAALWTKGTYS